MPININGSSGFTGAVDIQSTGSVLSGVTTTSEIRVGNVSGGVTAPDLSVSVVSTASSMTVGRLSSVGNDNTAFRIRDRVDRTLLYTRGGGNVDIGQLDYSSTNLDIKNGNLIFSTSGTGIDFSATTNSSGTMTSELLSDYEEGTWTPNIIGSSTAGTASYTSRNARYTKTGRLVFIETYIQWGSGTGSGNLRISGLPFSPANSSTFPGLTVAGMDNLAWTSGNQLSAYIDANVGAIFLAQAAASGARALVPYDASGEIIIGGCYSV